VTALVAEDLVCDGQFLAFRSSEALQGANLNGAPENPADVDMLDDVLRVVDLTNGMVYNSHYAVTPCRFEACDPRLPYRVVGDTVKFLSFEPNQTFDLNEDGTIDALVIVTYDVSADAVRVVGTPTPDARNPLQGGDPTPGGGGSGTVYETTGLCIEDLGTPCASCDPGAFCGGSTCMKEQGPCRDDGDCPPGITCEPARGSVPASPDTDADGVPDHLDNCVDAANPGQQDTDGDAVGDACDLATCGNGLLEYDEGCDGTQLGSCTGACPANCRCDGTCAAMSDPRLKILVKTRREIGKLVLKTELPLPTFDAMTPVTIRLDDANSTPIVTGTLASVPASGNSGSKFLYKVRTDGLQKVLIRRKPSGAWLFSARAKHWFTAAAADDEASDTLLTVNVGTQCFTHAATLKVD